MNKLNTLRSAATAAFAVAALSLPTLAQASDYHRSNSCKSQENEARIAGAVIGAVLGGVLGSEVSGNGARTEGTAIGAVIGGLAGAGIGDEAVNCDKRRRTIYNNGNYTSVTYGGNTSNGNRRYSGQTYGTTSPAIYRPASTHRRPVSTHRGYGQPTHRAEPYRRDNRWLSQTQRRRLAQTQTQLDDVRFRLRDLREEDKRLERRIRRRGDSRWAFRRQNEVRYEIERLRNKKRRLQKRKRRILNS